LHEEKLECYAPLHPLWGKCLCKYPWNVGC